MPLSKRFHSLEACFTDTAGNHWRHEVGNLCTPISRVRARERMRTCFLGGDSAQYCGDEVESLLDVDGIFPPSERM